VESALARRLVNAAKHPFPRSHKPFRFLIRADRTPADPEKRVALFGERQRRMWGRINRPGGPAIVLT
jgi:hypothetical protein